MAELSGPVACPQCGARVAADDAFCPRCGGRQSAGLPVPGDPLRAALERALGTQYDIQRLLGRGGMGAVFLARERSLDRLVAIKILPPETAADADTRERFRREARTAAKLTHPNIVPLYAFGDVEGMLYFVMGYVRGESLADRMRRDGKVPPDQARRILKDVAEALEHAHRQGVVHRDIKPDNILLDDETGRPMLTDFGVAKARASGATLTEAGMVVGTPYYMSPEQASGARDLDGRSDLYSLGVLGYAMLAGRVPFEGDGFHDLIVQHISREPPPLEALAPGAPRDLVAAVTRCLAKAPEQRWPDARSLAVAVGTAEVDDDVHLAFPLRQLDSGFLGATGLGLGCVAYAGIGVAVGRAGGTWAELRDFFVPLVVGFGVVAGMMPAVLAGIARRRGHSWAVVRSLFLRPPVSWRFWWPAEWRRSTDVWSRLPAALRRIRSLVSAGLAVTLAIIPATIGLFALKARGVPRDILDVLLTVALAPAVVGMATLFVAAFRWERWGRACGLTSQEAAETVQRSTTDLAFWRKPKFAALLEAPGLARPALADPQSPAECVSAIADAARQLAEPLREVGREATDAARQLAASIAALDAELTQLARDANPAELASVEQKLSGLGDATADNDARRQMRALLESQRDLFRKLAAQLDAASVRRAHLNDLLKALWLQTANLRAQVAADAPTGAEISGRVKALCADIDAHVRAAETVRELAGS
jgi:hypothetical protein